MPKTTWKDIHKSNCDKRKWYVFYTWGEANGRSRINTMCPFCKKGMSIYLWSLAGSGKRCKCGALFGPRGYAYKIADSNERN